MAIRFARSASRHGISADRARHVIEHCPDPVYQTNDTPGTLDRVLFLGPDQHGIPIELVALALSDEDLLVIHVMHLRRAYLSHYQQVMEWHRRS